MYKLCPECSQPQQTTQINRKTSEEELCRTKLDWLNARKTFNQTGLGIRELQRVTTEATEHAHMQGNCKSRNQMMGISWQSRPSATPGATDDPSCESWVLTQEVVFKKTFFKMPSLGLGILQLNRNLLKYFHFKTQLVKKNNALPHNSETQSAFPLFL